MIARLLLTLTLNAALLTAAHASSTSNLAREKAWAEQITDSLIAGEPVWLTAANVKFLSLYTPPANPGTKGMILLHGRGVHPAWGFIDNLRVDFADAGWHTLSLQMPILDADTKLSAYGATFPEAFARIDAGIGYLKERGVTQLFLVGHSSGATTAVAYAAEHPNATLAGIAGLGITTEPTGGPLMEPAQMLAQVKLPVLDIYGAEDVPIVRRTAQARRAAARRAGNARYTQEQIANANHFYTDRYEALRERLMAWLDKTAK